PITRLPIAEAQHEVAATRRDRGAEAVDEPGTVVVVEDVEQPAVEHGVELLAKRAQLQGIAHEEAGTQLPVAGLALGDGDSGRSGVDAGGGEPQARNHERVLARAAA